jgi:hypothetical protein
MIVFEKTRQLARRVPFQRALAARGLALSEPPKPVRYRIVEEVADDGPSYVTHKGIGGKVAWDEDPEVDAHPPFDRESTRPASPESPLYENHEQSAQREWQRLVHRRVLTQHTKQDSEGRQMHVEFGESEGLFFLYCANTFDQRQFVVVAADQRAMLERYYEEIVSAES